MKKITGIFLLACLIVFAGCKPDDEFDGPDLNDLYGEFFITQTLRASNDSIDFATGENSNLTATFSKKVNWSLTITGLESGAKKTIEDFSSFVDIVWDGSTTKLPMFHEEICAVELTFANQPDTLRDTVEVFSPKTNQGWVMADFETGLNPGWEPFVQSGANMSFIIQNSPVAAQGTRYYDMGGEVTWDWLIGLLDIPASAYGAPTFPLSSNASNLYFNTFLYKPDGIENGLILFQFSEDDNGDGVYTSGQEDMFSVQISGGEDGWTHIYKRYDQLATLVNGAEAAPIGNGIHEPDKLMKVSVLFLANPSSGYSQAYLDYMIFTENTPLHP